MQLYRIMRLPQWLNRNVFGFSLASFFSDVSQEMSLALLPTFLMTLVSVSAAPISMGVISGVSEAVAYATRLPFGWISDRYNHKKLLIGTGYGLSGLFLATISLATHAWHVLLARSISRLGKGMRDPARDSLLAKSVGKDHYGAAFGFNRALDTLGAVMGLILLEFIAPYFSVRHLFIVCAIPAFLAVLTIVFVVNIKNNVGNHDYPVSFFSFFRKMPTAFLVFVGIVGLFSIVYAHVTLFLMFTQYFFKFSTTQAIRFGAFLYIVFNIVRFVTEGIIGIVSDYVNRYVLLAIMSYGSFALVAFLLLEPAQSTTYFVCVFMLLGVAIGSMEPVEKAIAADLIEPELRSFAFGLLYTVKGFGMLAAGIIVGSLWSYYTASIAFTYIMVVSLCALVSLLVFARWYRHDLH